MEIQQELIDWINAPVSLWRLTGEASCPENFQCFFVGEAQREFLEDAFGNSRKFQPPLTLADIPLNNLRDVAFKLLKKSYEFGDSQQTTEFIDNVNCLVQVFPKKTEEIFAISLKRGIEEESIKINQANFSFLSNISHEIRTPLNAIIGVLSIMNDSNLTEEQSDYMETLKQSSYSLLGIINDILDVSRLETGNVHLSNDKFNLIQCIDSSIDIVVPSTQERGLKLSVDIDDKLPAYIYGDPQRLRQILVNLLSNATKFTKKGEIVLTVKRQADIDPTSIKVIFCVKDTGIGISKESQKKLFVPFQQLDQTLTKEFDGTGLGLAITKNLVELMGGQLWFKSQVGKGSEFFFTIVVSTSSSSPSEYHYTIDTKRLKGVKVLVIDDKDINRQYLQKLLYKWSMSPVVFSGATEALIYLENSQEVDIGLIDICMPKVGGINFANKVYKMGKRFPMIALSSYGEKRTDYAEFVDYIFKPTHEQRLIYSIYQALFDKKESPHGFNQLMQKANIIIAEDVYLNQKVMINILNKLGYDNITVARDGSRALDLLYNNVYDLLLLDIKLPKVDGITIMKKLNKKMGTKRPKIIAITAMVSIKNIHKYMQEGYLDSYLIKPIEMETLKGELLKIFKH